MSVLMVVGIPTTPLTIVPSSRRPRSAPQLPDALFRQAFALAATFFRVAAQLAPGNAGYIAPFMGRQHAKVVFRAETYSAHAVCGGGTRRVPDTDGGGTRSHAAHISPAAAVC